MEKQKTYCPDNFQHILQSFNEGVLTIDKGWKIKSFKPSFQAITDLSAEQLTNANFKDLQTLGVTEAVLDVIETAINGNAPGGIEFLNKHFNRWLRVNIYPHNNEVIIFIRDVTDEKIQQLVLALEKDVLELNAATSHSLQQTINQILKGIENIFPDMISSVIEVDDAQERIYHYCWPKVTARILRCHKRNFDRACCWVVRHGSLSSQPGYRYRYSNRPALGQLQAPEYCPTA